VKAKARRVGQEEPGKEELTVQYADYAAWQRAEMNGGKLEAGLKYWKKQLEGMKGVLELPTDHPRPAMLSGRGEMVQVRMGREESERLKRHARGKGLTLYMEVLGAVLVLLKRYSGEEEVVVGSPVAGRTRKELEGVVGFFVNTLVLRVKVDEQERVEQLLERVKDVALGAYEHQQVPFEKIVEELQPERDLSRQPLFQVMYSLDRGGFSRPAGRGLPWSPLPMRSARAFCDLSFSMLETEHQIEGSLVYSTDLFERQTISRMGSHFTRLLKEIAENPVKRISDLSMLQE
jgi:non-ribosomal peptide synthetase component F